MSSAATSAAATPEYLVEVAPAGASPLGAIQGPVYRNAACDPVLPLADKWQGLGTCWETFTASVARNPKDRCLGERVVYSTSGARGPYVFESYQKVYEDVERLAVALRRHGLDKVSRVGVYGQNSPQWIKAMLACSAFSGVCVPLYDSLGPQACSHILQHSGMEAVFVQSTKLRDLEMALYTATRPPGSPPTYATSQSSARSSSPAPTTLPLKLVVVWGLRDWQEREEVSLATVASELRQRYDVQVITFERCLALGSTTEAPGVSAEVLLERPRPEDLATIMYTSGTTGVPKGVMLTHRALVATIASQLTFIHDPLGRARMAEKTQQLQQNVAARAARREARAKQKSVDSNRRREPSAEMTGRRFETATAEPAIAMDNIDAAAGAVFGASAGEAGGLAAPGASATLGGSNVINRRSFSAPRSLHGPSPKTLDREGDYPEGPKSGPPLLWSASAAVSPSKVVLSTPPASPGAHLRPLMGADEPSSSSPASVPLQAIRDAEPVNVDSAPVEQGSGATVWDVLKIEEVQDEMKKWPGFQRGDAHLSYLPLAHIYERALLEAALAVGAAVGCWSGDVEKLQDDARALQPAIFVGVPRVWERVQQGVQKKLAARPAISRWIYKWFYDNKLARLRAGVPVRAASWLGDLLVFKKVQAALGGKIKLVISGAAPLSRESEEFIRTALGCHAGQGYGLTETCSATCITLPDCWDMVGTVGPVQTCAEIRLESVPDMGYDALGSLPRGELLIRGPCCFEGYYKDPQATAEVLQPDGWFHTGDIVELQPSGALRIIDRKKNLIKLAQGEYVPIESLETTFKGSVEEVQDMWVYGDPLQRRLVAVVVPDKARLLKWWSSQGLPLPGGVAAPAGASPSQPAVDPQWEQVCASSEAKRHILESLRSAALAVSLPSYQQVAAVHLEPYEWTPESGLLTPTHKLKRHAMKERYGAQLAALYHTLG